jgi:N-acetylglucosaminyldiphosphoundecaprenol N-acetyl-beta-D-mannosaminyltransferase
VAQILGTAVEVTSLDRALVTLADAVAARRAESFGAGNVFSVALAHEDPAYQAVVDRLDHVLPDGMPLVWAQRRLGFPQARRVHGDDLFLAACRAHPRWRHFLLGGAAGQPEQVAARLRARIPDLNVVGCRATPERPLPPSEHAASLAQILEARADVVWVGMGTPAQDRWMDRARPRLRCPAVGVGSAFDLLTDRKKATPTWMKDAGLQWLHRWTQDPRRLTGRYLRYNTRFIVGFARQVLRGGA